VTVWTCNLVSSNSTSRPIPSDRIHLNRASRIFNPRASNLPGAG
jgi:hypothetical protein